jgi:hypothetical protein
MAPTLRNRYRLLALRTLGNAPERLVGRAVVFDSPLSAGPPLLVKRVVRVDLDGRLIVEGDNPVSLGSSHFGPIATTAVRGVAVWRIGRRAQTVTVSRLR